jgi:hypothetical protein
MRCGCFCTLTQERSTRAQNTRRGDGWWGPSRGSLWTTSTATRA